MTKKKNHEPVQKEKPESSYEFMLMDWDLTEQKRVETALLESEERYRTLFQNVAEGILVATTDTRQFIHANPAICRMLGYSYDEIYTDPIIRKVFTTLLDNAIQHGKTLTKIQFSAQKKKGNLIITCGDYGVGIPKKNKNRIFERGYGINTGIGLFLALEILSITGFSIRETEKEGEGARFEIGVPKIRYRLRDQTEEGRYLV